MATNEPSHDVEKELAAPPPHVEHDVPPVSSDPGAAEKQVDPDQASLSSHTEDAEKNGHDKEVNGVPPDAAGIEKQADAVDSSDKPQWVTGVKLYIITAAISVVSLLMLLDVSVVTTAAPKITDDFNSLQYVGWYGAGYQLACATLQPLTGKIYSNFNTKWSFVTFFCVFEFGSLLCGTAVSSNMLIVGRAVAGMGASGLQNGALTILAGCVPMAKRPPLFGILMGVAQLGLLGGPLLGGLLTQFTTWRWCFYINLPVGGVVAAALLFIQIPDQVPKPPPRTVLRELHKKLDLIGFALFAPAAIMLLLAVQYGGNQYRWNSSVVIGLFCGAGVLGLIWLAWDYYKKDDAMLPFPMLKKRYVWSSCLLMSFISAAMFMTNYFLPIYFQGIRGKTPAISGVYLLPSILTTLLFSIVSGKIVGKTGYYMPVSIASGALAAIGYGLLSTLTPSTPAAKWIGYQILFGTGRGLGFQVPFIAVQNTLVPSQVPVAMSLVVFFQTFGGALWLSFADTIFTNSLQKLIKQDAPGVDVGSIIAAGAYRFEDVVPKASLANVLKAYAMSVDKVFYACAALSAAFFAVSWLCGWVDIRKEKPAPPKAKSEQ